MACDLRSVQQDVSAALVATTRAAMEIAKEDLAFHKSSNPTIIPFLEQQNRRLLNNARKLTRVALSGTHIVCPVPLNLDTVDEDWSSFIDLFDNLLEKADTCLDEFTGSIKSATTTQENFSKNPASVKLKPERAYRTAFLAKPQLSFSVPSQNHNKEPFKPLLIDKPHAKVPLTVCVGPAGLDESARYAHPYKVEIETSSYPAATFLRSNPISYQPYEATQATLVDTPELFASMLSELKQVKEIAVDLEHHDEHSYIGLVCLMQLSTRDKDWVVDTLKPWRQDLQKLNAVFADPNILKVFHGAFMDIIWLQRDLGLYVVGLFDTYHASRALGYPRNSLAYLLKRFANFDAAKQYQMADWRIRPLPHEMFEYARSDTHFLLHVYDNLRNELIDKSESTNMNDNLIDVVQVNSKEEALQTYERPIYDTERGSGSAGWYTLLCRTPALFNSEQFAVFKAVHQWRDGVARDEDESVHSIMPRHVLFTIARETPVDMPSLLGCSHPMSRFFQRRKEDLLETIKHAKTDGFAGPNMIDVMKRLDPTTSAKAWVGTATEEPRSTIVKRAIPSPTKSSHEALSIRSHRSRFWGMAASRATVTDAGHEAQDVRLVLPLPGRIVTSSAQSHSDRKTEDDKPIQGNVKTKHTSEAVGLNKDDIVIVKDDTTSRTPQTLEGVAEMKHQSSENMTIKGQNTVENASRRDEDLDMPAPKRLKMVSSFRPPDHKAHDETQYFNNAETLANDFDYVKAPSVLHMNTIRSDQRDKGLDPYVKSLDAPKGMRKSQKEIAGKSHTFEV